MIFNRHTNLEGLHAPFGASKSSWLRYDDEKAVEYLKNIKAAELGTRIHAWAAETIKLGIKQPRSNNYLSAYVNDAIGFRMDPEVVLFYSEYFFGTADAISFRNNTLRIHDLKTGGTPVKMEQLEIYAALFCLEYKIKPGEINIELRIYQKNNDVQVHNPTAEDILPIMDKIIHLNKILESNEGRV
jgi:hypothetical protein